MTASYFTRSKAPRPSECGDVEPSDVAPVATSSSPSKITVRPNVAAAGESGSMSTEPAEPVSAHPSPAGRPTSPGGPGVEGPAGSPLVGVSALRYPSGLAGPPAYSKYSSGQVSTVAAEPSSSSPSPSPSPSPWPTSSSSLPAAAPYRHLASRQPSAVATETAAAEGLTVYLNKHVVSIAPFSTPACPDCSQNIT